MSETNLAEQPAKTQGNLTHGNLTQGPILRTLILFAIPALLANMLQTVNGTINSIWVGQLLGEGAIAATANANMVMFLFFAAVFGFGMASTVRVGVFFGAKDITGARRAFGTGLGFCTGMATAAALLGWIFAPQILHLLSTPPAIHDNALAYLRVIFISMPFGTIGMMLSMSLRGAGDAKLPMFSTLLTVALDTALNPLLIAGIGPFPKLGIAGSALASLLANLSGALFLIIAIYMRDKPLRLRGSELGYLVPRQRELAYVLAKGIPMGAQMLIAGAAGLFMVGLVNREGLIVTAAYGAALQIWNYVQMPAFAISTAVSAMVAQNIGAGQHDRVSQIARAGVYANLVVTGLITMLLLGTDRPLFALFLGSGSDAIPVAEHIQLYSTWSYILMGVTMILTGTMRAYGAVMGPLIILIVTMFPIRLGFYQLTYDWLGQDAIWWAYPVGAAVSALLTGLIYTRGSWRRTQHAAAPLSAQLAPEA